MHSWRSSPHVADSPGTNRNRSVAIDGIRTRIMTFQRRRALHIGGANWLLLCAAGHHAMAEDAAAPSASTQLPEITVTAPSPIQRHRTLPSRTPTHVARAAPGQNRERPPEPQATPVAAAPQQGVLPVVTDQFATV